MTELRPTNVRFQVLGLATVVAFLMYLDRICLATIVDSQSFKGSVPLSQDEVRQWARALFFWLPSSWREAIGNTAPVEIVKSGFFWAYALAQVPAGWLSDRFGSRVLISVYIALWSLFTAGTSFAWGFTSLLLMRLGCGIAEAGYYPASSGLLTKWAHIDARGFASSIIAWGGRVGGAAAPFLTAGLIVGFSDWRWAGWIYGAAGLLVAVLYWWAFRDHPRLHPRCNEAEIALLAERRGDFQPVKEPPRAFPWRAACLSGNLWLLNGVQFFTNVGWVFLVLHLGKFLQEVGKMNDLEAGRATTIALTIGVLSLPLGGWLTDALTRRYGKRLGRMLPMSLSKFVAAGCYLLALQADSAWLMVLAFGAVTFFGDLGLPSMWTIMQDISGRHQAQLFGWGNMWGNIGAGIMPFAFAVIVARYDTNHDFHEGVYLCAGAFVVAGVLSWFANAERPVEVT
jgi:MFS family permease